MFDETIYTLLNQFVTQKSTRIIGLLGKQLREKQGFMEVSSKVMCS